MAAAADDVSEIRPIEFLKTFIFKNAGLSIEKIFDEYELDVRATIGLKKKSKKKNDASYGYKKRNSD